jgi:chemotaxis signal transduction protein
MASSDSEIDDTTRAILRARTIELAAPPADDVETEFVELLVLRIGTERYGIATDEADAAIAVPDVTPLPGVPTFYRGVITHRGIVYPLVDIRPLVDRPAGESTFAYALLFASEERTVAIAADEVEGFVRLPVRDIATTIPANQDAGKSATRGLAPGGVLVLDAGLLLRDARLDVNDRPHITAQSLRESP